jgi:ABC-2 type transport system ATP-binding protein
MGSLTRGAAGPWRAAELSGAAGFTEAVGPSETAESSLRASGVGFRYGSRRGVEDVDLEVSAGEIVALLGPNGSGKSTLLRLLGTALRPMTGRIEHSIPGAEARRALPPRGEGPGRPSDAGPAPSLAGLRRSLGQAADEPVHVDVLSGLENALFFARAAGLSRADAESRVRPLMELLGLDPDDRAPVGAYSFGMRRKLLLVQALAHDPPVLLLDEPTIGLDPASLGALERLLRGRAAAGAAVVLATNDVTWVAAVASRVVFLHEGRKVRDAPPAELLAELQGRTEIDFAIGSDSGAPTLADPSAVRLPEGCTVTASPGRLLVHAPGPEALPPLCRALLDAGLPIRDVRLTPPTLAGIFRRLTGAELAGVGGRQLEIEGITHEGS